jgi:tRNA dimethylallyltransferase
MKGMEIAHPLVVIVGPTGSGKSDLALALAGGLRAEIVSCDSLQLYRGMDLGTAKVPAPARRGVPHHLYDLLAPDQVFTAGDFARMAREALAGIAARAALPIVVGGAGFYLRALVEGLVEAPPRNESLRERLRAAEQRRPGFLHRCLLGIDRSSASRIHANDVNKLIRAIEISRLARRPASEIQATTRPGLRGFRVYKLGLDPDRGALHARLNHRTRQMFDGGLLEEVRGLLAHGFPPTSKAFEAVAYKEAVAVLEGRVSTEEAIVLAQAATRQYAKRQWTWFRRDPEIQWLHGFGDEPGMAEQARRALAADGLDFALIPADSRNKNAPRT